MLHQPFHRVILSEKSLEHVGGSNGFRLTNLGYGALNTKIPFINQTFMVRLSELLEPGVALGENTPSVATIIAAYFKDPMLLFYGLLGYWFPKEEYRYVSNYHLLEKV